MQSKIEHLVEAHLKSVNVSAKITDLLSNSLSTKVINSDTFSTQVDATINKFVVESQTLKDALLLHVKNAMQQETADNTNIHVPWTNCTSACAPSEDITDPADSDPSAEDPNIAPSLCSCAPKVKA